MVIAALVLANVAAVVAVLTQGSWQWPKLLHIAAVLLAAAAAGSGLAYAARPHQDVQRSVLGLLAIASLIGTAVVTALISATRAQRSVRAGRRSP